MKQHSKFSAKEEEDPNTAAPAAKRQKLTQKDTTPTASTIGSNLLPISTTLTTFKEQSSEHLLSLLAVGDDVLTMIFYFAYVEMFCLCKGFSICKQFRNIAVNCKTIIFTKDIPLSACLRFFSVYAKFLTSVTMIRIHHRYKSADFRLDTLAKLIIQEIPNIVTNNSLIHLSFLGLCISDSQANRLATVLKQHCSEIEHFTIADNDSSNETIAILLDSVPKHCKHINVSYNNVGVVFSHFERFTTSLSRFTWLESLVLSKSYLSQDTQTEFQILCTVLSHLNKLEFLKLKGCELGSVELNLLALCIANIPNIKTLCLASIGINDTSVTDLAKNMIKLQHLQTIDLSSNHITDTGARNLLELLPQFKSKLVELHVGNNNISHNCKQLLAKACNLKSVDTSLCCPNLMP